MTNMTDNFKHESLQDRESINKYFEALKEGFANGSLSLSTDTKRLLLKPHGLIRLRVAARRKEGQVKLILQLRWNEEVPGDEGNLDRPLVISAGDKV